MVRTRCRYLDERKKRTMMVEGTYLWYHVLFVQVQYVESQNVEIQIVDIISLPYPTLT
jgi:hypothetical protein